MSFPFGIEAPSPKAQSRRACLLACCAAVASSAFVVADEIDSTESILLEWSTAAPRSSAEHVRLRVFAGGLIQAWPAGQGERRIEHRTAQEVKDLLDSILRDVKERELSTESIQADLAAQSRQTGLSFQIRDADDSIISVQTAQGRQSIRCSAAALLAERFPNAARLQAFAAIERRLGNLNCVVQCGGREKARELCRQANGQLLSEHPKAAEWTIDDLTMVRTAPAGGRFIQFRHQGAAMDCWTGCITETPGFAPRVSVLPPPGHLR